MVDRVEVGINKVQIAWEKKKRLLDEIKKKIFFINFQFLSFTQIKPMCEKLLNASFKQ